MATSETMEILVRMRDQASAELKNLNKEIGKTKGQANIASRSLTAMKKTLSGVHRTVFSLKGALAGLGIGLLAKSFLGAASEAEGFRVRLVALTGSVDTANKLFDDMANYASSVSFEYKDIMESATNLTAVMKGGPTEVKKYMPIIADLAAVTGLTIQDATSQVIRMYSAGAAAADMFRERGVLAMLGFQAGVHVSAEETKKQLIAAWEDPASKIRGASVLLSHTWSGMMSMIADAWFQFRNTVMESGVFDWLKGALDLVLSKIRDLKKEGKFDEFAKGLANNVIVWLERAVLIIARISDAWRGWKMLWAALTEAFSYFGEYLNTIFGAIFGFIAKIEHGLGKVAEAIGWITSNSGLQQIGKDLQNMNFGSDTLKQNAQTWREIRQEAVKTLNAGILQESNYSKSKRLLDEIRKKAKEAAEAFANVRKRVQGPKEAPEASLLSNLKSDITRYKAFVSTALTTLNDSYKKGEIDFKAYFDKRRQYIEESFAKELKLLNEQSAEETNPDKKLAIEDKIFVLRQKHTQSLDKLAQEEVKAKEENDKKKLALEQIFQAEKKRIQDTAIGGATLQQQFDQQMTALDQQHTEEIQKLKDLNATKDQLEDAYRNQQLEKDNLLAQQRKQIAEMQKAAIVSTLGSIADAMGSAYEASGKKIKAFFLIQKAASIANTIISTYEAAQNAYASMIKVPIVGTYLAPAAAAAAIVAGMARVTMIRAQGFIKGGQVSGPGGEDNIPAMLTDKEYVMNPKAVQTYGVQFMEALNRRMISIDGIKVPSVSVSSPKNTRYAGGGSVSASASNQGEKTGITIVNVTDPSELDSYLASAAGQDAILNVLSSRAETVRRLIR